MVSKAFQVLSDPAKKRIYDQTGADPESRNAGMANGFGRAGGVRTDGAQGTPDDVAEELFRMFFSGGNLSGFQTFTTFGGGPNVRGQNPFAQGRRQRPAPATPQTENEQLLAKLFQLLPLLLIFIPSLLSSLFGSESDTGFVKPTKFDFTESPPYTEMRTTPQHNIPYYVNPADTAKMTSSNLRILDRRAEVAYINMLKGYCSHEYEVREQKIMAAQGWFRTDEEALQKAKNMELPYCKKLNELGIQIQF